MRGAPASRGKWQCDIFWSGVAVLGNAYQAGSTRRLTKPARSKKIGIT
jgi:hypothetical protein